MDNIIYNQNDEAIGYYDAMKKMLQKQGRDFIKGEEYESAQDTCEMLIELENYKDFNGLLVMSENNGMGWTIREYKNPE